MAEDKNLKNKSVEDLQKEKLQAEIDILHARLDTEFPDDKPPGFLDKLAGFAQKWSAFILGTVTLISAVFGVFVPLSEYLDARKNALEYNLNENMIGFVEDLNNEDLNIANRSVMMLSYYEANSIPILLFSLESSRDEKLNEKIIETISLIYLKKSGSNIGETVIANLRRTYDQLLEGYLQDLETSENARINSEKQNAILNYLTLIESLKLSKSDRDDVKELMIEIKDRSCTVPSFLLEIEFDIYLTVCDYLGVEMDCN